jgi:hypothetical protein
MNNYKQNNKQVFKGKSVLEHLLFSVPQTVCSVPCFPNLSKNEHNFTDGKYDN